ncbi:MAG: ribonuclease III [Pseudomonadota bacterium]
MSGGTGRPRPDRSHLDKTLIDWADGALGHRFADAALLASALTHSSGGRGARASYERLEFLGDRVLGLVIAEWLYAEFDEAEGDMNRRLAALVDKKSCAEVADGIGVSDHVIMDMSARDAGVHRQANLLGDICEALIAALYLDGGLETARTFIRRAWAPQVSGARTPPRNPKNELQEWAQGSGRPLPAYQIVWRDGPDHAPSFRVEVSVRGLEPAMGAGSSKQDAEKAAARAMLARETGRDNAL